ncbi:MAG: high-potential iron-sulfur protein [Arenimonas sp.]
MTEPDSRRRVLARAAALAAAVPLLGLAGRAVAAPLPKLPLGNPQAKALHYIEDASKSAEATHKAGSACKNCQFFTATTGACALFAGFSVAPAGWCTAWAKKA